MKVSAALLQKITSNISGSDLKITGLIPFDATSQLCEALANNESTERLDLEGCGIGDKGCLLIKDLLIRNTRIKHVDLQMNQISDIGCKYLAESISQNTTLHRLYLGYNDIRDDGVLALIGAMRPRGQLEIVVSGNTHVSEHVLSRLDRALELQWTTAHMSASEAEACFQRTLSPPPKYTFRKSQDERRSKNIDDGERRGRNEEMDKIPVVSPKDKEEIELEDQDESDEDSQPASKKSRSESSSASTSPPKQPSLNLTKIERPVQAQQTRKPENVAPKVRPTASLPLIRSSPKAKNGLSRSDSILEDSEPFLPELDKTSVSDIFTGTPFTFKISSLTVSLPLLILAIHEMWCYLYSAQELHQDFLYLM